MTVSRTRKAMRSAACLFTLLLALVILFVGQPVMATQVSQPLGSDNTAVIIEQLRLKVPEANRAAWLEAEQGSWGPWLSKQSGFLGRELLWDPKKEEAMVLIRWASREQWKSIPQLELDDVQDRFERLARKATGQADGNPFPIEYESELLI